jgi:HEAT repeat protein
MDLYDIRKMSGKSFDAMCRELLHRIHPDFKEYDGEGIEGVAEGGEHGFQCYAPEVDNWKRWKNKIRADLDASDQVPGLQKWTLIISVEFKAPALVTWLEKQQDKAGRKFRITPCWGAAKVLELLRQHADIASHYFPQHSAEAAVTDSEIGTMRRDYLRVLKASTDELEISQLAAQRGETLGFCMDSFFVPLRAARGPITPIFADKPGLAHSKREAIIESGPVSISDLLEKRCVAIAGAPGTGKSALLQYIAHLLAKDGLCEEIHTGVPFSVRGFLPMRVRLSIFAEELKAKPSLSLRDFLLGQSAQVGLPLARAFFDREFEAGQVLFLMDGLDEVEPALRSRLVELISQWATATSNRFLVSSRTVGYRVTPLPDLFERFNLCPFQDEDIAQFICNWHGAGGKDLFEDLTNNEPTMNMARNPLLLALICLTYQPGRPLARQRVCLYRDSLETLSRTWTLRRAFPDYLTPDLLIDPILSWLAHALRERHPSGLMSRSETKIRLAQIFRQRGQCPELEAERRADETLDFIAEHVGIFYEKGVDANGNRLYGFLHPTFEEYLSAIQITKEWRRSRSILVRLHDPRWREPLLLAAGQIGILERNETEISQFIQAIRGAASPLEDVLGRDLRLAVQMIGEDVAVKAEVQKAVIQEFLNLWKGEVEAGFFDHLTEATDGPSEGAAKREWSYNTDEEEIFSALGRSSAAAQVRSQLVQWVGSSSHELRRAATRALGWLTIPSAEVVQVLHDAFADQSAYVQIEASRAYARLSRVNRSLLDPLRRDLADTRRDVRISAIGSLGETEDPDPLTLRALVQALDDEDFVAREEAVLSLGKLVRVNPAAIKALGEATNRPDKLVSQAAAGLLVLLGQTNEALIQILTEECEEDQYVPWLAREGAQELLRRDKNLRNRLLKELGDSSSQVRMAAADALAIVSVLDDEVVARLCELLDDKEWLVRCSAVGALAMLHARNNYILEKLCALIEDEEPIVRHTVVHALGILEVAGPGAMLTLSRSLSSEEKDASVRTEAARVLGKLRCADPAVVADLRLALHDSDSYVRTEAAGALIRLGHEDALIISVLCQSLTDPVWNVRVSAAKALGSLRHSSPQVLQALRHSVSDEHCYVRSQAAMSLRTLAERW